VNSFSASQEIPQILWNPKIHYHVHNSFTLVSVLRQINPIQSAHAYTHTNTHPSYFFKYPYLYYPLITA